jgi:hypothetical protein
MFSFLTKKDPETVFIKKADRDITKEKDFLKPVLVMFLLGEAGRNSFNRAAVHIIEKHTLWEKDPVMAERREFFLHLLKLKEAESSFKLSKNNIKSTITNTDSSTTNDNICDEQMIQTIDRSKENLILVEYWFYILRNDQLAATAHKNVIKRAIKRLIEQNEIPTNIYSDLINRSRFYQLIIISQAMISLGYASPIEKLTWTKLNYSEFTLIENITDNDVNKYLQGFVRRYTLLEDFKIPYLDLDMLEW